VLEHLTPSPSTVPGRRSRSGAPRRSREHGREASPAAARAVRTTRARRRASHVSAPRATSRRKCEHSRRSGSSFGIFGLKMSPVRVRHSPYVCGRLLGRLLVDVTLRSSSMSSNTTILSRRRR
jgi:hypothetical protein